MRSQLAVKKKIYKMQLEGKIKNTCSRSPADWADWGSPNCYFGDMLFLWKHLIALNVNADELKYTAMLYRAEK